MTGGGARGTHLIEVCPRTHPPVIVEDRPLSQPAAARIGGVNVLLVTLDQFRGDCLSVAGHPIVRTPNLDRLAAAGRAARAALQPGGAVQSRSRVSLHRHVSAEQPRRRERHAARRALRQSGARGAAGRLRADALRLHRPEHRPARRERTGRPAAVELRGRAARLRRRPRAHGQRAARLDRAASRAGLPGARRRRRGARARIRTPGRARRVGVPHRRAARLDRAAARSVVRARELLPAASAVRGGRALRARLRPRGGAAADRARRRATPRCTTA